MLQTVLAERLSHPTKLNILACRQALAVRVSKQGIRRRVRIYPFRGTSSYSPPAAACPSGRAGALGVLFQFCSVYFPHRQRAMKHTNTYPMINGKQTSILSATGRNPHGLHVHLLQWVNNPPLNKY